ncbi:MAG: ATP-binding protein [Bacteroidota bacterium]|nr:ATP-binding protein [Bacteroidota bacterium]
MIQRQLKNIIIRQLFKKKAIIIIGPRQSGKTTLMQNICNEIGEKQIWLDGDEPDIRKQLSNVNSALLKSLIGNNKIVIIDEAQRIKNIGLTLKLITDKIPEVQLIVSGSSALELSNKINEPLTGRKYEYFLFPISFAEQANNTDIIEEKRLLNHRLIYGYYPDVVTNPSEAKIILKQLSDSYLYKDILTWENLKRPEKLERLIQLLAYQIGSQISYNELANSAGLDNETVERYIYLLEKAFIVFRLNSYSRNLRNELKKSKKIYFYDNGIRNAVINNFKSIELRNDTGALWENFLICERMKYTHYNNVFLNKYFWRTRTQQEIDYIEERDGKLYAYEFKRNPKKKVKISKSFINAYPDSETKLISTDNYTEFIYSEIKN